MTPPTPASRLLLCLAAVALLFAAPPKASHAQVPEEFKALSADEVPYELDPNAPGLTRAERIRRQEQLIRVKQQQAREERQRAARERAEENRQRVLEARERAGAAPRPATAPLPRGGRDASARTSPEARLRPGPQPGTDAAAEATPRSDLFQRADHPFPPVALYLIPATLTVAEGERFLTEVHLMNMQGARVDEIQLILQYPPDVLTPVAVHQDALETSLAGAPELSIDRENGVLRYRADLAEPLVGLNPELIAVQWEAAAPTDLAEISLEAAGMASAAYRQGVALTRNEFGPGGMLVGSSLRVIGPGGDSSLPRRVSDQSHTGDQSQTGDRSNIGDHAPSPAARASTAAPETRPFIYSADFGDQPRETRDGDAAPRLGVLYREAPHYEPGETVTFDFVLDNPARESFDTLALMLNYDPEALEFIDTDQQNFIALGTNLLDGPFADKWGWTRHLENRIDPDRGTIRYRMGYASPRPAGSGVVARAVARVKKPTRHPLVEWIRPENAPGGIAASGLWRFGENLMREQHGEVLASAPSYESAATLPSTSGDFSVTRHRAIVRSADGTAPPISETQTSSDPRLDRRRIVPRMDRSLDERWPPTYP